MNAKAAVLPRPHWRGLLAGLTTFAAFYALSTAIGKRLFEADSLGWFGAGVGSFIWAIWGVLLYLVSGFIVGFLARSSGLIQGVILGLLTVPALPILTIALGGLPNLDPGALLTRAVIAVFWCALGGGLGGILATLTEGREFGARETAVYAISACVAAVLSGFVAFFVAGAIVFPFVQPYYATRALFTLGVMYGVESVIRLGHITTCGLLSGNCSEHSVRTIGFILWSILLPLSFGTWIVLCLRRRPV